MSAIETRAASLESVHDFRAPAAAGLAIATQSPMLLRAQLPSWEEPLKLQVKGRNLTLSSDIEDYAVEKVGKLERFLSSETSVEVELSVEKNPSIAENQVAEGTIWAKGAVLRARETSSDPRAAIDLMVDKLERQVKRYKDKRQRKRTGRGAPKSAVPLVVGDEVFVEEPVIVKTKQFAVKPMTPEEAVLQLELIGHDFFMFRNVESSEVNVIYRRRDGNFGLIESTR